MAQFWVWTKMLCVIGNFLLLICWASVKSSQSSPDTHRTKPHCAISSDTVINRKVKKMKYTKVELPSPQEGHSSCGFVRAFFTWYLWAGAELAPAGEEPGLVLGITAGQVCGDGQKRSWAAPVSMSLSVLPFAGVQDPTSAWNYQATSEAQNYVTCFKEWEREHCTLS